MKNRPMLITGCQRSGTTLLHLILGSHPEIHSIDEMEYSESKLYKYLYDTEFSPQVAFKIPVYAPFLDWIKKLLPELRVLWLVRNPRDVVASMMATHLLLTGGASVPWPSHPLGGTREILHCTPALPSDVKERIHPYLDRYQAIAKITPTERRERDVIFVGALCWKIKNELLKSYDLIGIPFLIVCYEKLVTSPKEEISKILKYLGLSWHDNVLKHNLLHKGILVGKTEASRAIDTTSIGRWKNVFSVEELHLIDELTADLAKGFSYKYEETT